jgi:hypothetical protein
VLPIKRKEVLQLVAPVTVTWYRLLVGSILLAYLAAARRSDGGLRRADSCARADCT